MSLLFRWQGATLSVGDSGLPPQAGYGDFAAARSGRADLVSYPEISTSAMSGRTVPSVSFRNTGSESYWEVVPNLFPSEGAPSITGPYSIRLYYRRSANHATRQPIIRVREGNVTKLLFSSNQNNAYVIPGLTGAATALSPSTSTYRMEIQVDPDRSPKVVWRIYLEDETTALRNRTANPSSTVWDNIRIGHMEGGMIGAPLLHYSDIEIHDDYDLGGQFTSNPASPTAASTTAVGAPSSNPTVDARFNYNASTNVTDAVAAPSFTSYLDVDYTTAGTYNRKVNIYVPDGPAPEGGRKAVIWAHAGFFTEGSRNDLAENWRNDLLNAGHAVVSVGYVLSSIAVGSYPSYGSSGGGGRYPSHIIDFKRAAAFIRDNAATYGINPDALIAAGTSAGGYVALGAMASRGLAADSAGNPMTLAGASASGHEWGDGYTGDDPEFIGCLIHAGPVSMDLAKDFDPTSPNSGAIIHIAYRAFQGLVTGSSAPSAPHTSLASHMALNAENLAPVLYVRGSADYLVHWEHEALLSATIDSSLYTLDETPNNHDAADNIYDRVVILDWIDSLEVEEPSGPSLFYYDGSTEHPVTLSYFDGETERAATFAT